MRRSHKLRPVKGMDLPQTVIFFDTETKEKRADPTVTKHHLVLGWTIFWQKASEDRKDTVVEEPFETGEEFWDIVERHSRPNEILYLVAHNMTFDFTIVQGFKHLVRRGWKVGSFYGERNTVIIAFKKKKCKLLLLDQMNFFPMSLKEVGKEVGLPKTEIDFKTCGRDELSAYCLNDCRIMLKAWHFYTGFIKQNDLGNFARTVPAQAFSAFKHRFMPCDIFIHGTRRALELEREGYYGGRVEAFYIGKVKERPIAYLDVNSMFPYVMRKELYPVKLVHTNMTPMYRTFLVMLSHSLVIAEVTVTTDKPLFPVRRDYKTFYPTGTFKTVLCTPELKLALAKGRIEKVHRMACYEGAKLFDRYVNFFHCLKTENQAAGQEWKTFFAKLMLNSLYGKFGQKSSKWKYLGEWHNSEEVIVMPVIDQHGNVYKEYIFAGQVWQVQEGGEGFDSFPAIAAHVTSYARTYLYKLLTQAGLKNVYYCDTDSLMVNEVGFNRLKRYINPGKLGSLDIKKIGQTLTIYGCKDYILDREVTLKGISRKAKKIAEGVYEQEHWPSLKGLFQEGDLNTYKTRRVTKTLIRKYDKGVVTPSGRVAPFQLAEGSDALF